MMAPLCFLDTETTGLALDDEIWEFACIRREDDGTETTTHLFIQHSTTRCGKLPPAFRADHEKRFPASHTERWHPDVRSRTEAAREIAELLTPGRPHIVGAVPNFDAERLAIMLRDNDREPGWHYHLIDVENLAVGYLAGLRAAGAGENGRDADLPSLPWRSDDVSLACGVEPPGDGERHTALGDATWAMRLYDRIVRDADKKGGNK